MLTSAMTQSIFVLIWTEFYIKLCGEVMSKPRAGSWRSCFCIFVIFYFILIGRSRQYLNQNSWGVDEPTEPAFAFKWVTLINFKVIKSFDWNNIFFWGLLFYLKRWNIKIFFSGRFGSNLLLPHVKWKENKVVWFVNFF